MGDGTQEVDGRGAVTRRRHAVEVGRLAAELGHRPAPTAPPSTVAARRRLMRTVTAEVPAPREDVDAPGGDRAARREALLHVLEMSRRRRDHARR